MSILFMCCQPVTVIYGHYNEYESSLSARFIAVQTLEYNTRSVLFYSFVPSIFAWKSATAELVDYDRQCFTINRLVSLVANCAKYNIN